METVEGLIEAKYSAFALLTVLGCIISVFIKYWLFIMFMIRPLSLELVSLAI